MEFSNFMFNSGTQTNIKGDPDAKKPETPKHHSFHWDLD